MAPFTYEVPFAYPVALQRPGLSTLNFVLRDTVELTSRIVTKDDAPIVCQIVDKTGTSDTYSPFYFFEGRFWRPKHPSDISGTPVDDFKVQLLDGMVPSPFRPVAEEHLSLGTNMTNYVSEKEWLAQAGMDARPSGWDEWKEEIIEALKRTAEEILLIQQEDRTSVLVPTHAPYYMVVIDEVGKPTVLVDHENPAPDFSLKQDWPADCLGQAKSAAMEITQLPAASVRVPRVINTFSGFPTQTAMPRVSWVTGGRPAWLDCSA